jgi:AcrR family transcriptional regulator
VLHQAPAPSLREINCEARRQRILEAARTLITDGGMPALSMRKLAQEADVSVTTLYNLFGARNDILAALVHDAIDRIDQILEREAPLDDPIERCRAVITVSVRYIADQEATFRPMIHTLYQGLSLGGIERSDTSERAAHMQRIAIEKAIDQGLLHDTLDPGVLASQIYHGYDLACCHWAYGLLDADGFRARALYGLYVALLAVATDRLRPALETELRTLERELGAPRSGKRRARPRQPTRKA